MSQCLKPGSSLQEVYLEDLKKWSGARYLDELND